MHMQHFSRRFIAATLVLFAATACKESTSTEEDEPEVATMRLTVGSQTVTVAENGAVTGGPLRITTAAQTLTAAFLKADGSPETLVNSDVFRLEVTGGTGVTFTRASQFAGSIRGTAAGNTTVSFSLFHTEENHNDFGPFPVAVQIQ